MKKSSRHSQRIWALQILYGLDIKNKFDRESVENYCRNFLRKKGVEEENYTFKLVKGISSQIEILDANINKYAIDWKVDRMPVVDRNIMRIAIYEIKNDIPIGVAINEAVRIAKKFGDDDSPSFINGILAKIK
ncbi:MULTISPECIES: transcription antitermination factor NusB [unclassified Halanaerobium]|uniref:transcription antitermination factor NusB n=1 Tax=unclassified Halanaerobium TaxID=2641197 RepID=UPI000DF43A31|nr:MULTISPECIES: transcription antitermination factor NusB [unclassified Halanaerobium]RCW50541.1 NusB antitermination factor [Halanaerobium sp. MA284_MarDTE_T2]RCW86024.1 NusB antitermination factor [Halanaerobium sp. DL-01]